METTKSIEHLPYEVIIEIFSYLSFKDIVHSVQYVSYLWADAAHDTHLWKNLVYEPEATVNDSEIANNIYMAPKLQTVLLSSKNVGRTVIKALIKNCENVKRMEFHCEQYIRPRSCNILFRKWNKLEHLKIPLILYESVCFAKRNGWCKQLKTVQIGVKRELMNVLSEDECFWGYSLDNSETTISSLLDYIISLR